VDFGQFPGLGHHGVGFGGHHLGAHRRLDQVADGADMLFKGRGFANSLFGAEAGVGGHSVHQAQAVGLANLIQVGGVDEKFHDGLSSYHKS
jgi:hypothetical protein